MNRFPLLFVAVVILHCPSLAKADSYIDNFEGQTVDPFWMSHTLNANMALSTEQAHSGTQSLRFDDLVVAGQKTVQLSHSFSAPVFGTFSVWLRDPGFGGFYSLYANPSGPHVGWGHRILVENGPSTYQYSTPDGGTGATTVTRTAGWHQLQIAALANSVTYSIDDQAVYNAGGAGPISTVTFIAHDANAFPTVYFDDFSAVWTTVPEPSSVLMAFAGTLLVACLRRWPREPITA